MHRRCPYGPINSYHSFLFDTLPIQCRHIDRARKLYTSARIYEWKFGKGEWKLPFASPTRRVDFFGFVIIFEGKKELTSMFYSLQKQRKHSDRSVGFKCH